MRLKIGDKYNWINQPERLVYLGYNFSSNGRWHQFAEVAAPEKVWCECLKSDLINIEKTKAAPRKSVADVAKALDKFSLPEDQLFDHNT